VSARQAQRYLKVANNWQAITKNDATSHLTIDDAIATAAPQADENGIDAWTAKIEALPIGRLLFGNFRHGFVVIFQSSQHVGYYHCYSYFISPEFEGGEAQETKRPMKAWGIANMMTSGGMKPDDFSETEQGRFQEHNIKGTLTPTLRHSWRKWIAGIVSKKPAAKSLSRCRSHKEINA
jgi:hypothetical protein